MGFNLIYLRQQIASVGAVLGIGHSSRETVTFSPSHNGTGMTPSLPARKWEPSWSSSKVMRSRCDWLTVLRTETRVYMVASRN